MAKYGVISLSSVVYLCYTSSSWAICAIVRSTAGQVGQLMIRLSRSSGRGCRQYLQKRIVHTAQHTVEAGHSSFIARMVLRCFAWSSINTFAPMRLQHSHRTHTASLSSSAFLAKSPRMRVRSSLRISSRWATRCDSQANSAAPSSVSWRRISSSRSSSDKRLMISSPTRS